MESRWPKISIVIPVYNGSDYVKEAIESALTQTYPNFEVMVVNDGSSDRGKTERVAKKYGRKIRYFKKKNGGVATALNFGISKMRGEWFSWLSHDDVYPEDRLTNLIKIWQRDPRAKFVYGKLANIDEVGLPHPTLTEIYDFKADKNIPLIRQMLRDNAISGCTTLIHKGVFNVVGKFDEKNRTAQDYDMWLKVAAKFPMHRCNKVVIKRRVHAAMGTIQLKPQVRVDTKLAVTNALESLPIEEMFSDRLNKNITNMKIASCRLELGDLMAIKWRWFDLAMSQYCKGLETNPGNQKLQLRVRLGPWLYHLPKLVRYEVREKYWKIRKIVSGMSFGE